jgi:hypothetical protein
MDYLSSVSEGTALSNEYLKRKFGISERKGAGFPGCSRSCFGSTKYCLSD